MSEPKLVLVVDDANRHLAEEIMRPGMPCLLVHPAPEPEKLSPLRAAMARLDSRLNGKDRRALRRAQNKINGTKESFAAMSARLQAKP